MKSSAAPDQPDQADQSAEPDQAAEPGSRGAARAGLFASAAMIAAITVVSRVIGFGRWGVFSHAVGATCVGDAYASANVLPNILYEVVAGGALAAAVVPLLVGPLSRVDGGDQGGRQEVDAIASALLSWAVLVLVPLSAVLAALSGPLSHALIHEHCPGQRALTARLILVFAPQIALYGVGVVLTGVLTAHRRFFWPAAAPLLSSLVVIAAYLAFGATSDSVSTARGLPPAAEAWLAWGTTGGVAVMTLPLLLPVRRAGVRLRPSLRFPPGAARRGLGLAGAGIGALLAQQGALLVVLALANHSRDQGAFPVFQYAQAVYLLPYAVLAVPLATSAFPRLAERANRGDAAGYAGTASISTRAIAVAALFGAAVLAGVAVPVADFFTAIDHSKDGVGTALPSMGTALTVMAPGLLGFGLIAHLGRALYALERGRAAAVATAAGWLAVIVGSVLGTRWASVVVGLAWGNTIGMTVAGALLLLALRRCAGPQALAGLARVLLAGAAAAALAAVCGRQTAALLRPAVIAHAGGAAGAGGPVLRGLVAGTVSAVVFVVLLAVLDRKDLTAVLERQPLRRSSRAHAKAAR
jgi:putative peptidoglycan lipid II flippase